MVKWIILGFYEIKFIRRLVTGMSLHHNIFKSEKGRYLCNLFKYA